ncbi:MAG TPA: hypothetical protein PJ991_03055 [Kiritimatiellia bacterium]|nr:hypothetical protein [Kiritimatiellia bacterium]
MRSRSVTKIVFLVALGMMMSGNGVVRASLPVFYSGDVNGDGRDDLVQLFPGSPTWTVLFYHSNRNFSFDLPRRDQDIAVVGRFFLNTVLSPGYYDYVDGRFMFATAFSHDADIVTIETGMSGCIPVIADFDGDGLDDLGLYRKSDGTWHAWRHDGVALFSNISWGFRGAIPFAADLTGDGMAEIVVHDPARGAWYSRGVFAETPPRLITSWGFGQAQAMLMDFNGNRRADLAIWDRTHGKWYVREVLSGETLIAGNEFGDHYGIPTPGRFEDGVKVNLSYVSMGHGIWTVLSHAGRVVTPNMPEPYQEY